MFDSARPHSIDDPLMALIDEAPTESIPTGTAATAAFYVTGGTVPTGASSYVTRQADSDLLERLRAGEFCYVLNSRQMGKSSLMVRTALQLRAEGVAVAVIDLTAIGQNLTAEQWYEGLLCVIGEQLDLEDEVEDYLARDNALGPLQRFMIALRQVILPRLGTRRLVLFIDEIDAVRSLRFTTDEFFAATRECYNRRTTDPEMKRLTFCLLGVATPADLIRDVRTTPFNIGRRVELTDFTTREAAPLAQGMSGRGRRGDLLLQRVLYWTGGHPYLTQRLCQAIAEERSIRSAHQVDRLCAALFLSNKARETDDNLTFVENRMLKSDVDRTDLLELYTRIWRRIPLPLDKRDDIRNDDSNPLVAVLLLAGVVRPAGRSSGSLSIRNRIYRAVFDLNWVDLSVPDTELRRQRTAVRRAALQVGSAAFCVVALILWLAATAYRESNRARTALDESKRLLYIADMNLAQQAWDTDNVARVAKVLHDVGDNPDRGFEWNYLNRLCHLEIWSTPRSTSRITALAFVPGKSKIAIGTADGEVETADSASESALPIHTGRGPSAMQYSSDSRRLLVDGQMFDTESGSRIRAAPAGCNSRTVTYSRDSTRIASCQQGSGSVVWDSASGQELARFPAYPATVNVLGLSKNGAFLAAGTNKGTAAIFDVLTHRLLRTLPTREPYVSYIAFAGAIDKLVTVSNSDDLSDSVVETWDTRVGRRLGQFRVQGQLFAVSPDGAQLAAATARGTVAVWSIASGDREFLIRGNTAPICGMTFSSDGRAVATANLDGETKVWDSYRDDTTQSISQHEFGGEASAGYVSSPPLSPSANSADGKWFVKCGLAPRIYLECAKNAGKTALDAGAKPQQDVCVVEQAYLKIGDAAASAFPQTREPSELHGGISCADFAPDGTKIITGSGSGIATVWATDTGEAVLRLVGHSEHIISATYSPDGKRIVTSSLDGTIRLWESRTGRQIFSFSASPGDFARVALFSPDGTALILAHMRQDGPQGGTTVYSSSSVPRSKLIEETREAIIAYNRRHIPWT